MNNNKLIAEFMGVEDGIVLDSITEGVSIYELDSPAFYISGDSKEKVIEQIAEHSEYHTSWDWLMPVLQKIIDTLEYPLPPRIMHGLYAVNIDDTYNAVVEFIEADNMYGHKPYPYSEGQDYWSEQDGEYIWGVWDDISEALHQQNPNRQYYTSAEFMVIARQGGFTIK